jgi:RNA polymerase sigma-70 factor (ECF subfamily)
MRQDSDDSANSVERFRQYLQVLVKLQVDPRLQARVDASGVIQQTLLEAHQTRERWTGWSEPQQAAWLRRILANNLNDELRKLAADRRDVGRERSLDAALEQSSSRLAAWLASEESSPSQKAERHEQALQVAEALARLPEAQRDALVLQHWHGWSLEQIGQHLGRSPAAVAGLLHRGLKQLKDYLHSGD